MADKQLTVAELMARAQKENPEAQPRRRRRRSLDEGGISVAELTGSLKAVDARPAEVKHSSVPIDDEPEKSDTPKAPAQPKPSETAKKPAVTPAKPAAAAKPTEAAEKPSAKPESELGVKQSTSVKVEPAAPKPAPTSAPKSEPKTESKPAPKPEAPVKPETPVQKEQKEQKEQPKPQAEAATRSSFKAVAPQPKKTEQTGPITRVVDFGDRPDREVKEGREDVDKRAAAEPSDIEATQETPVVRDEHLPEETVRAGDVHEEYEEDNSVNPIMLVLLVFAGLVVGVLVFLGFQYLWTSLNPLLVGVLALAVTGGVVLLVRAMKTGRDALTMTLAALAGAAMTFGPALVSVV